MPLLIKIRRFTLDEIAFTMPSTFSIAALAHGSFGRKTPKPVTNASLRGMGELRRSETSSYNSKSPDTGQKIIKYQLPEIRACESDGCCNLVTYERIHGPSSGRNTRRITI